VSQLVLSLFPGVDLLGAAFKECGFCVVQGGDPIFGGDIRKERYPAGKFDGVIGGPPCQSFSSLVHLVRANGHEPRFGNLIPEFERCVSETEATWFVMENVPAAPVPVIEGYGVKSFLLDNSRLLGDDNFGQEQRRVRRISFGLRGVVEVPSLMRWIDLAVWVLPDATGTVSQWSPDNSKQAKCRQVAVTSTDRGERPSEKKTRTRTVTALGLDHLAGLAASAEQTRRSRKNAVLGASSMNAGCLGTTKAKKERRKAVSSSNGGNGAERNTPGAGNNGKGRYKFADACRLQGLPEDFLKDAPFTADGKLKAVANGVPRMMGRAIAKAVLEATEGNRIA